MYISCPECNTKFIIKAGQIGHEGRKVKCSKCLHIWHQKAIKQPQQETKIATDADSKQTKSIHLPVPIPVAKSNSNNILMQIIFMVMILFMSVMLLQDRLGLQQIIHNKDIIISDVQIIDSNNNDDGIVVSYKIHNSSANKIKVPTVRIRLIGQNHHILQTIIEDHSNINIAPNNHINIKTKLKSLPPKTTKINIMTGNKIDFMVY